MTYMNMIKLSCHNCGGNHDGRWCKCPKPNNKSRIKENHEECAANKQQKNQDATGSSSSGVGAKENK